MLEINNYNSEILKDITFKCKDNLTILGENGSGKSTLAKVVSLLIQNEAISFNNNKLKNLDIQTRVKTVNYIPTKLDVFDQFISIEEFLKLSFITNLKDLKIDDVLEILNIKYLKEKYCKNLSSGEAQLLLIASAILHNAKYTILDEPTANLDQIRTKKIFDIIKNSSYLQNKIVITHDLNLAYKLNYDILYLQDGTIKFQGTTKEFFTQESLDYFFQNSVKKCDDFIVGNL